MHRFFPTAAWLLPVIFLLSVSHQAGAQQSGQQPPRVFVISISGEIEPGMAAFLRRALDDIPDTSDSIIVVQMDTFGGRVDSALEMVDSLTALQHARTIAYVTNKAISAGALISLACNRLVMKHHTTIGDCAPITYSEGGPKMMGEKFQSPLRAKFRTLAKRNNYPPALAEAMVSADLEVYRIELDGSTRYMDSRDYQELAQDQKDRITSKTTIVAKGELLTMDDSEALDLGFSSQSVASLNEMLRGLDLDVNDSSIVHIEKSWSENLVTLIGTMAPILMLIGLGALYTEIKAPGFGIPGLVGILCLSLVFFNQFLVGLADYTELLIIVAGLVCIGFELFVLPGFGISGIAGILLITAGMLLSMQDFVVPDPNLPWEKDLLINNLLQMVSAMVGAFFLALFLLRYVLPHLSRVISGPYLDANLAQARVALSTTNQLQPGQTGVALTQLRPSGKATIDGEPYDVVTQGEFIPKGEKIHVLRIKGTRIIVTGTKADV